MQYHDSLSTGLDSVALLGVHIPIKPTKEELAAGTSYNRVSELIYLAIKQVYVDLGDRKIMDLFHLPQLTDRTCFAILTMLSKVIPAAFFIDVDLALLLCAKIICISMSHGNCTFSCLAYLAFGWLERRYHSTYELSYEWGMLGHQLCESYSQIKPIAERSQCWEVFGTI